MLVVNRNIINDVVYFFLYEVLSTSVMVVPYNILVLTEVFRVSSSFGVKVKLFYLYVIQIAVDTTWSFGKPTFLAASIFFKNILSGGCSFSGLRLYRFFSLPYYLLV